MLAYAKVAQYHCATATGARTDSVRYPNYCFSHDSLFITLRSVSFARQGKRNNLFSIRSPPPRQLYQRLIGLAAAQQDGIQL